MVRDTLEQRIPGEAKHQPELDGIRGIAILCVLASHAAGLIGVLHHTVPHQWPASVVTHLLVPLWGGVDLFFVLSGFLITGILLRTRQQAAYFRSFYMRRALRIFPVYYFALLGSLAFIRFVLPGWESLLPQPGLRRGVYFLYLQNVPLFTPSNLPLTGLWGLYWSLAAEEQFYLIWPMLVRLFTSRAMLILASAGFLLGLPVRLLLMKLYFGVHFGAIQMTVTRADGLFIGAAIALYTHRQKRLVPRPWIQAATGIGASILLYVALFHPSDLAGDGLLYTAGVTAFALLGGALVARSQYHTPRLQRGLTVRWLRAAGKYSYGMYVYHLFLYVAINRLLLRLFPATGGQLPLLPALAVMAAAVLLTFFAAKASFDLFESKLLALKRFFPASGRVTEECVATPS